MNANRHNGEPPSTSRHGVVGTIAAYIETARTTPASEPARQAALKCLLDLLGAAASGIGDIGPAAIRKAIPDIFGPGTVPIWFTSETRSIVGAAFANSAAAAALDLDDGNRFARGHPGAAVIPAALAVGRETQAGVEDIIAAIVIGYEVGVEVGRARTAYGSSGLWTPYGVVAAAAALRRTPRDQIEHALAIAGESAPNQAFAGGPAPRDPHPEGAAVKEGIPWAVVTGLSSLYLAEAGFTGPRNILDSRRLHEFPDILSLGSDPHICKSYFKPYACCRHIHAPLAAMLDLMTRHGIKGHDIDAMAVEIHAAGLRISNRPEPRNLVDVQYSIPYSLALAALHGPETLMPLTDVALRLKGVGALAKRVRLQLDQEFDKAYPKNILARVTITCAGQSFVSEPTPPPGEPLMPWEQLEEKFKIATRLAASGSQQSHVLAALRDARAGDTALLRQIIHDGPPRLV